MISATTSDTEAQRINNAAAIANVAIPKVIGHFIISLAITGWLSAFDAGAPPLLSAADRAGTPSHPPPTQGVDQYYGRDHALSSDLRSGPLIREQRRLGVDDIEIADQAGFVPVQRDRLRLLSVRHSIRG
jgi:hypothetical protein